MYPGFIEYIRPESKVVGIDPRRPFMFSPEGSEPCIFIRHLLKLPQTYLSLLRLLRSHLANLCARLNDNLLSRHLILPIAISALLLLIFAPTGLHQERLNH